MKQLTLVAPRRLEWREAPEPKLTHDTDALVRPIAVGVCDFDRAVVAGRYTALVHPVAVGHEIVAEVLATGAAVRGLAPGQKVVLPLHISCGSCPACRAKRTNSCEVRPPLSNFGLGPVGGDWGGGMSDVLRVPYADAMAVPLPDAISPVDAAAVGCNLVDIYRTLAPQVDGLADQAILILSGQAPNMALYAVVMAKALGISRIDFLDDDENRLTQAELLGAKPIKAGRVPGGAAYPVIVDCSGTEQRLASGFGMLAPDGVCTSVWPTMETFNLPIGVMFLRNARYVTGQPHALAMIPPVLDLMQRRGIGTTSIPTEVLPWEDAATEFGSGDVKRVFVRA